MTSRRQALERHAAMAVAGEIASGRVVLDGDGCLPLEALVAARARRTASARRVIAILQGWNWVRRVGPGRWTVGDGGADPHRAARADFPPDGKCAACTRDLTGAYTSPAAVTWCCAPPAPSPSDRGSRSTTLSRWCPRCSGRARRRRRRAWRTGCASGSPGSPGRRSAGASRTSARIGAERAEAAHGLRYAEMGWRRAEELAEEEAPDVVRARRRSVARPSSGGHLCRVCGWVRANEKFTGKGHARRVCTDCERAARRGRKARRAAAPPGRPPDGET